MTGRHTFPLGVYKLKTSAYFPSGNGSVECVYHTMARIQAMVCSELHNDWDAYLSPRCTQTYDKRLLPER